MRPIVLLLAANLTGGAQTFEVASLKLASQNARGRMCKGGPGTSDPGLWTCTNVPLGYLINSAYDLQPFQFRPPDYVNGINVDVSARVPPGTSKDAFRRMQQALLVERFRLQFHYEPKEMPVFEITVAKPGLMHESQPDAKPPAPLPKPGTVDRDGYPVLAPGQEGPMTTPEGRMRWRKTNASMTEIAKGLELLLGGPVVDSTGLSGKYDVTLSWYRELPIEVRRAMEAGGESPPPGEGGPTIRQALLSQLGLKVESKKAPVKVFVLDHADRAPAEN